MLRRATPRRHPRQVAPDGIEPPNSGSKGRHPSPTGTPGLHSAAALRRLAVAYQWLAVRSAQTGPLAHTTCCELEPKCREQHSAGLSRFRRNQTLEACRRQARVPQPRAGSPRGGRVMRARMSGQRRIGARHRNWRIPDSSVPDRICPHAVRAGARRRCDPRLWTSERAVGCGELSSY
jgi:hypothetical protein